MVHPLDMSTKIWNSSLFYYSTSKFIELHTLHMSTNKDIDISEAENIAPISTSCDLTLSYNAYLSLKKD
jgi:hypothetical protein